MSINEDFEEILNMSHYWNWLPDWSLVQKIYNSYPDSYSILTPFAYSYLEECIRSTTSEYGREIVDENGNEKYRRVGSKLVKLAMKENNDKDYILLLQEILDYFEPSKYDDEGNNRNGVEHGYLHPRFWTKESFEKLIHDIARISKYTKF